ncbi:beta-glucuronidase-like [Saccoglossus kowalevskii]
MLYPRESESRESKDLSGMWNFRADMSSKRNAGFEHQWQKQALSKTGPVIDMPVPSSFNDITQDKLLRDFVGWVWYDREFYPPYTWQNTNQRVVVRFESAHYYTIVWLNGVEIMMHDGGHLPFESEITDIVLYGKSNRLTVAVNNTLSPHSLPPGTIEYKTDRNKYPAGYFVQNLQMDFFNYAGIQRPVKLYTTPKAYIDDISIVTDIEGAAGFVNYDVKVLGNGKNNVSSVVNILDKDGNIVASKKDDLSSQLSVSSAHFWWPYTMSNVSAYMYILQVSITSDGTSDVYRLPFGIRTIRTTSTQILINNKSFYCLGVGKHEDSDTKCSRSVNKKWTNENFSNKSLTHHLEVMDELVRRDKNRPSVIMWSVANEPASEYPQAEAYFKTVISQTKQTDPTRPVTFVMNSDNDLERIFDEATQFVDVVCINSYFGWYEDTGHPEVIQLQLEYNLREWYKKRNKPIIQTEYGAGSVIGIHLDPGMAYSEDYQVDVLKEHFKIFDKLRKEFLVGEMIWNFADFMTAQDPKRVAGNRKGVFTRQRQPKMAAYQLRERYQSVINETTYFQQHP